MDSYNNERQKSSQNVVPTKKNGIVYLIGGSILAIISFVLEFKRISVPFFGTITSFLFFVAIIILFIKEYRYIAKNYLLGFFGTLITIMVVGFLATLFIITLKNR